MPPAQSSPNQRKHEHAKNPTVANNSTNGDASADAELAQEKDAATDAAEDLQRASIEDKE